MINFYYYSAMYFLTQTIDQLCNEQYLHHTNTKIDTTTCNLIYLETFETELNCGGFFYCGVRQGWPLKPCLLMIKRYVSQNWYV